MAYRSAEGCWRLADHAHHRPLATSSVFKHWRHVSRGTGQPGLGDEDASRTHLSPPIERVRAVCWWDPLQGQDDAIPWAPWLDERFLVMDHRGDPGSTDLAPPGHRGERAHARRCRLPRLSTLEHGSGVPGSPCADTGHHRQSDGRSTPGQGLFRWRSIDHGWSGTSGLPACQTMAPHVHGLIAAHAPSWLVVARLQGRRTGRTLQLSRRAVDRCACTAVPWGAQEVESCVPA